MNKYHDERPSVFHLDGHNGNWHNTVKVGLIVEVLI